VNVKAISKNVGMALLVSALFMLISVFVSMANGKDSSFGPLLISFIITFMMGVFPFIFVRKTKPINIQEGFVIIVLSWFLSFIFGMLPYVMWGGEMSLVDAWFESVSGFTTTGATILTNIEALPHGLLFWRSSTHFIGGLGVVVFLLLIVPSASPFRQRLTQMEVSSLSKEGFRIMSSKLVKVIGAVYVSLFVLSTVLLLICGMPLFDAVTHGFSLAATGGFSIKNESIAAYDSNWINTVCIVFMLLSTLNFVLLYTCFVKRSLKPLIHNKVAHFYLSSVVVMSLIVVFALKYYSPELPWTKALMDGFATTVSYATTTGFAFADNSAWPMLAGAILLYAAVQCGTAGSTSSGIKVDRMVVMFKSISRQIRFKLHPNDTRKVQFGDVYIADDQVLNISIYIVLYFIILLISSCLLLMCGVNGLEAISGSVACLGNVGPGLGDISIAGNYDGMSNISKMILTLDMFLGRIEIYPLLIVVSLIFNRDK